MKGEKTNFTKYGTLLNLLSAINSKKEGKIEKKII